jgi:hypothetical protein
MSNRCGSAARPAANFNLLTGLTAAFAGCEARSADQLLYSLIVDQKVAKNSFSNCIFQQFGY